MSRVDVSGIGIEYQVTGQGRPVVLLHGFPDSGRLWRHQVPALAGAGFQVIVPDLRGYGHSDKPRGGRGLLDDQAGRRRHGDPRRPRHRPGPYSRSRLGRRPEVQMTDSAENVVGPWRYERLDGPGHWLQLDAPDQVNALLLDFLR